MLKFLKLLSLSLTVAALAACAGNPLAGSTNATTQATTQQDLQWACFGLTGVVGVIQALGPVINVTPSSSTGQAIASAQALLGNTCTKPFDPTNASQDYQVLMSTTGQVAAIVAAAKATTAPIPATPGH